MRLLPLHETALAIPFGGLLMMWAVVVVAVVVAEAQFSVPVHSMRLHDATSAFAFDGPSAVWVVVAMVAQAQFFVLTVAGLRVD